MFVLASMYRKLEKLAAEIIAENLRLSLRNATLQIQAQHSRHPPSLPEEKDLQRLLQLCHPDKHGGKPMAVEMTQKLNAMRQSLRG